MTSQTKFPRRKTQLAGAVAEAVAVVLVKAAVGHPERVAEVGVRALVATLLACSKLAAKRIIAYCRSLRGTSKLFDFFYHR